MVKIKEEYSDPTLNIVLDTLAMDKQVIIFANTKNSAEKAAEEIAKKLTVDTSIYKELSDEALHSLPVATKQCKRLSTCIAKGVAFHHAGLTSHQRELIEDNFRKKIIKVIAATPTLAAGVDLPAFRVILKDLRRYGHNGLQYIPVLEYMQMSGRAGRPKFDNKGESIIIAGSQSQKEELIDMYINGEPEPIFSKLAVEPVLRTYILSLIAVGFATTKKELFDFFSRTFWAHQFKDMEKLRSIIEKMLELLEEWDFLISSELSGEFSDFKSAHEIVKEDTKYRATILGKRVAELYIDPYTAHFFVDSLQKATGKFKEKKIPAFSFLQLTSSTLEIRPLLRAGAKDYEKVQEALVKFGDGLLTKEPSIYDEEYDTFASTIKTTLFLHDWIEEKDEEYLLETYNIRPGEIKSKLDLTDWLLYCMEEITRILQFKDMIPEVKKLRIRLQYGTREELIPLLKLRNIGRVRSRLLYHNGIKDIGDIKKADLMKLTQIVGKNIALDIKNQVDQGDSYEPIKENKRKGQISLSDYDG